MKKSGSVLEKDQTRYIMNKIYRILITCTTAQIEEPKEKGEQPGM